MAGIVGIGSVLLWLSWIGRRRGTMSPGWLSGPRRRSELGRRLTGPKPSADTARRAKPRRANTTDPHSRIIATRLARCCRATMLRRPRQLTRSCSQPRSP